MSPTAQRLQALLIGTDTRMARAELKRMLQAGDVSLRAVFYRDLPWLRTMRIADLIAACPWMSRRKAERALRANQISPIATLFNVSKPRRQQVLRWLEANYPRALSRQPVQRGSLTKAQVRRIRSKAGQGELRRRLAAEHGVSESKVYSVIA